VTDRQTDRQTDGRTEFSSLDRVCISYSAVIIIKYSNLASNFTFQPIAVENLGAFSLSTLEFLSDLGHKLSSFSGEERASSFLFQRLSVSLQRFNSVLLHDTFVTDDVPDQ